MRKEKKGRKYCDNAKKFMNIEVVEYIKYVYRQG